MPRRKRLRRKPALYGPLNGPSGPAVHLSEHSKILWTCYGLKSRPDLKIDVNWKPAHPEDIAMIYLSKRD